MRHDKSPLRDPATIQRGVRIVLMIFAGLFLFAAAAHTLRSQETPSQRINRICRDLYSVEGDGAEASCRLRQAERVLLQREASRVQEADQRVGSP